MLVAADPLLPTLAIGIAHARATHGGAAFMAPERAAFTIP
jgi:hypothetical protein